MNGVICYQVKELNSNKCNFEEKFSLDIINPYGGLKIGDVKKFIFSLVNRLNSKP